MGSAGGAAGGVGSVVTDGASGCGRTGRVGVTARLGAGLGRRASVDPADPSSAPCDGLNGDSRSIRSARSVTANGTSRHAPIGPPPPRSGLPKRSTTSTCNSIDSTTNCRSGGSGGGAGGNRLRARHGSRGHESLGVHTSRRCTPLAVCSRPLLQPRQPDAAPGLSLPAARDTVESPIVTRMRTVPEFVRRFAPNNAEGRPMKLDSVRELKHTPGATEQDVRGPGRGRPTVNLAVASAASLRREPLAISSGFRRGKEELSTGGPPAGPRAGKERTSGQDRGQGQGEVDVRTWADPRPRQAVVPVEAAPPAHRFVHGIPGQRVHHGRYAGVFRPVRLVDALYILSNNHVLADENRYPKGGPSSSQARWMAAARRGTAWPSSPGSSASIPDRRTSSIAPSRSSTRRSRPTCTS